ncbi:MAG TPA: imidazolonepropionase [Candidatus Acidoferrales bacterium]|nr:imidazolonepropionase [Candidatus Acidoferrales bacterium]
MIYDRLWVNARLVTMASGSDSYGIVEDGALASHNGAIAWLGSRSALPAAPEALAHEVVDANGYWITPGLIDPHTHLVFAGDRLSDFERRIGGVRYAAEIRSGGGIASTVAQTRAADDETLLATAMKRLTTLMRGGVTTVEVKSGYGLDVDTELRLLHTARQLEGASGITVRATFLGAHVVPPEYTNQRDAYVTLLCETMIPRIATYGLADAVDVFCEDIGFSASETEQILAAARGNGLPVKLHADQLSDGGGATLAARFGALSADHLEFTDAAGIAAMAAAGTVAVVLPGAYYFLRESQAPPIAALRRHHVPIALATDCNPGTSPVTSLPTIMNLACILFGLTPYEALLGVTRNAALALGLHDRGELRLGARCDLALWDVASPAELSYWLGADLCRGVVVAGIPHTYL